MLAERARFISAHSNAHLFIFYTDWRVAVAHSRLCLCRLYRCVVLPSDTWQDVVETIGWAPGGDDEEDDDE